ERAPRDQHAAVPVEVVRQRAHGGPLLGGHGLPDLDPARVWIDADRGNERAHVPTYSAMWRAWRRGRRSASAVLANTCAATRTCCTWTGDALETASYVLVFTVHAAAVAASSTSMVGKPPARVVPVAHVGVVPVSSAFQLVDQT